MTFGTGDDSMQNIVGTGQIHIQMIVVLLLFLYLILDSCKLTIKLVYFFVNLGDFGLVRLHHHPRQDAQRQPANS